MTLRYQNRRLAVAFTATRLVLITGALAGVLQ
jgi:hypothetical protein